MEIFGKLGKLQGEWLKSGEKNAEIEQKGWVGVFLVYAEFRNLFSCPPVLPDILAWKHVQ